MSERIADKIAKLLAHAESTPYEAEREAFLDRVAQLAAEYSVDVARLGSADPGAITSIRHPFEKHGRAQTDVWTAIFQQFDCSPGVSIRGTSYVGLAYGYQEDLDQAMALFRSVMVQAMAQAESIKSRAEDHPDYIWHKPSAVSGAAAETITRRRSFIVGYGYAVAAKLRARRQMAMAEAQEQGEDLLPVLVERRQQAEDAAEWAGHDDYQSRLDDRAMSQGRAAGERHGVGDTPLPNARRAIGR